MGECQQQKHTQHAPSTKMECDYLKGWIKKWSQMQNSHPKWWTPEILLGNTEEEEGHVCDFLGSCWLWWRSSWRRSDGERRKKRRKRKLASVTTRRSCSPQPVMRASCWRGPVLRSWKRRTSPLCSGGTLKSEGLFDSYGFSRAEDPGFKSRLRWDFTEVESYQWLKNWHSSGYSARRLML